MAHSRIANIDLDYVNMGGDVKIKYKKISHEAGAGYQTSLARAPSNTCMANIEMTISVPEVSSANKEAPSARSATRETSIYEQLQEVTSPSSMLLFLSHLNII